MMQLDSYTVDYIELVGGKQNSGLKSQGRKKLGVENSYKEKVEKFRGRKVRVEQ